MSMGSFVEEDNPVVWRAPLLLEFYSSLWKMLSGVSLIIAI